MRHSQQQNEWQLSVCKCIMYAGCSSANFPAHCPPYPGPRTRRRRGNQGAQSEPLNFSQIWFLKCQTEQERLQRLPECGCPSHKLAWLPLVLVRVWTRTRWSAVYTRPLELATILRRSFHNQEEAPTSAFFWLKVPTSAIIFKNL